MKSFPALSRRARSIEPTMIRSLRALMNAETIDFGLGQADLAVSSAVQEAIRREWADEIRAPYTPNAGLPAAREAVGRHLGVRSEEVLLTCGVQEALAVAILGLVEPGEEVLVPDPGFPAYVNLVRAAGGVAVPYALRAPEGEERRWGLDVERVMSVSTSKTKAAILNNPSNPTGGVYGEDELRPLIEGLEARGIVWISDEIYEDYVWEKEFVPARSITEAGLGLTLSGLSKSHHLMGWRLGWMSGPAEVLKALTPLHQHLVTCAPLPSQKAAIAALREHETSLKTTRDIFRTRRRVCLDALDGLKVIDAFGAEGAFYLFLDVRAWLKRFGDTVTMAKALLAEENVLVIPGEGFGEKGLGHLRVAYTIGGDQLLEGLNRLRTFLTRTL